MTIKAIIFDFGQVLNAPQDPAATLLRNQRLADRLGLTEAELWPYLFEGKPARQWMTGRLSREEFWQAVLEPKGLNDPIEREAFAKEVFAETHQLHPEMVRLLHELEDRYILAVLSNASWTEDTLRAMLHNEHHIPERIFDAVITSRSAGFVKPRPEIFLLALERLGVQPQEAIFTDDLASFTEGAAALGIHVHTFSTPAEFRRYLVEMGVLDRG